MNGTIERLQPSQQDSNRSRVMAVRTGLSKTVCGRVIELGDRNEQAKSARIVVRPLGSVSATLTVVERSAITAAAEMLAAQARRFLGIGWTIHDWDQREAT